MIIRQAIRADLPAINRIYNQAVQQRFCTAHLEEVGMLEREHWFDAHDTTRYPSFVGFEEERVVGWVSLGSYREDRQALFSVRFR